MKKFNFNKRKWSFLSLVLSIILLIGSILGITFSIINVSENYKQSSEYTESLNIKFEVSPIYYNENDDVELSESNVKNTAKSYSEFLKSKGYANYDVWYEYYPDGDPYPDDPKQEDHPTAFIEANIPIEESVVDNETKKQPEELTYFDNICSNNRSLVYCWSNIESDKPEYSVIPFSYIFNLKKSTVVQNSTSSSYGIAFSVNSDFKEMLGLIYKDMKTYNERAEDDSSYKVIPEMYVINDLNTFINVANYYLYVAKYHDQSQELWDIYNDYVNIDGSVESFYKALPNDANSHLGSAKLKVGEGTKDVNYMSIFNFLDKDRTGTLTYTWMSKYVEQIITAESLDTWFPKVISDSTHIKNESLEDEDPQVDYLFYTCDSESSANELYKAITKYGFEASVKLIDIKDAAVEFETHQKFYQNHIIYNLNQPAFVDTVFGSDQVALWLIIGLGILLFLIGIILIIVYRFLGFFSWIMIVLTVSLSLLFLTISAHVISLGLIIGMILLTIIGAFIAINIGERVKRKLVEGNDSSIIVNKSFKKSFLTVLDLNLVLLIIGVCLVYFSTPTVISAGIILIIGSILSLTFCFFVNWLICFLFFGNKIIFNHRSLLALYDKKVNFTEVLNYDPTTISTKKIWDDIVLENNKRKEFKLAHKSEKKLMVKFANWFKNLKPKTLPSYKNIPTANRFENSFYVHDFKGNINIFNNKFYWLMLAIVILLISGIAIFMLIGINNTLITSQGFRIVIDESKYNSLLALGISFNAVNFYDGSYYCYFATALSSELTKSVIGVGGSLQTVVGNSSYDTLMSGIITLSIAYGFIIAYSLLRLNWTAVVPVAIGCIMTPLLSIGIFSMFNLEFDQNIIFALIFLFSINTVFSVMVVGNINSKWRRKEMYSKLELRYLINSELRNSTFMWLILASVIAVFIIIFGLTMPSALVSTLVLMIIGSVLSLVIPFYLVPWILYWFLSIRINYINSTIINNDKKLSKNNFDKIDEQLIEGINKFTSNPINI